MQGYFNRGKPVAIGEEVATEVLKAAPPVGIAALTMNNVLIGASIIYVCLQAIVLVHKYIAWIRAGKPVKERH